MVRKPIPSRGRSMWGVGVVWVHKIRQKAEKSDLIESIIRCVSSGINDRIHQPLRRAVRPQQKGWLTMRVFEDWSRHFSTFHTIHGDD